MSESFRYTLEEIDRMRAALWRKHQPPQISYTSNTMIAMSAINQQQDAWKFARERAEDELRTCMVGGVRPEELEKQYPKPELRSA